jgi:hypothetical protein
MADQAIWLSYDLGVRGDYEGLYAWLDQKEAKECGDSIAFLNYRYTGELKTALKEDLAKAIDIGKKVRVYLIFTENGAQKGTFLFGRRKATPWLGYGGTETSDDA